MVRSRMASGKIVRNRMVSSKTASRKELVNSGGAERNSTVMKGIKRRKRLCTVLIQALSVCLLTGCRLALEEAQVQDSAEDRLVGVFVTEEYLNVGTPELTVNSGGEISFAENREGIEGTLIFDEHGPKDIVFDGIEGYGIYDIEIWNEEQEIYTSYAIADDVFSDGYWAATGNDTSEDNTVEATIYVDQNGPAGLFYNPVYQTAQGDVYMQPGTGLSWAGGVSGSSSAYTMSQEWKASENGQETAWKSSFIIHNVCSDETVSYNLLFMGEDNRVTEVMTGDELVKMWEAGQRELAVPAETAYLILEQENGSGDTRRSICNKGEATLEFLQSADGGYMVKRQMNILWE